MRAVYISPDPADESTARTLGLGFVLGEPGPLALVAWRNETVSFPAPVDPELVAQAIERIHAAEVAAMTPAPDPRAELLARLDDAVLLDEIRAVVADAINGGVI